jgi:hypothetical protein
VQILDFITLPKPQEFNQIIFTLLFQTLYRKCIERKFSIENFEATRKLSTSSIESEEGSFCSSVIQSDISQPQIEKDGELNGKTSFAKSN